ncbi:mucin-5AC-like [Gastrophryne carolinensis]
MALEVYKPGKCWEEDFWSLCSDGHWNCKEIPCPSVCSLQGGSHIRTFDDTQYTFHGKCTYMLAKPCANDSFQVIAEIKKCAYSEAASCLTQVQLLLDDASYVVEIKYDNNDFPLITLDKEAMAKAGVSIFWPSSFFMIVYTNKGLYLEVQLTPVMQLYIVIEPTYKKKMCGLCGNYNNIQKDDFQANIGGVEHSAAEFANIWKTQLHCKNIVPIIEHPCAYGMETGNFIKHCPPTFEFSYNVSSCITSCRSLSEPDPLCNLKFFTVDGCICPKGTYLHDNGLCVQRKECPCYFKGIPVTTKEPLHVGQLICFCNNRTWVCDNIQEKAICTVYGDGNYITFDNKYYTTSGDCEYTLVQDYCDAPLRNGTFKVITENVQCGTTGTSCSVAITVYLGAHKLILADGHIEVLERTSDFDILYWTRKMGIYLVVETKIGLVIVWDQMTTIFIHLSSKHKGRVCGLCGNFDGNSKNDFTTRSRCLVEDVNVFRDSWKISSECPEVYISKEPCAIHPYRISWAQKMCSIINSNVFKKCHAEVRPEKYYDACVRDTCACDAGEDCHCYCTAIAAYAQACSEACACVHWRTPTVCPLSCDFGQNDEQCEWHYKACGAPCLKTCRNPSGKCHSDLKGLEGCYPICPVERPYFNEDEMLCVAHCGCVDQNNYYKLGEKVESCNVCEICFCTENGIKCQYDQKACNCEYQGQIMNIGDIIEINEDEQDCIIVKCEINGTEETPCRITTENPEESTFPVTKISTLPTIVITKFGESTKSAQSYGATTKLLTTAIRTSTPNIFWDDFSSTSTTVVQHSTKTEKPTFTSVPEIENYLNVKKISKLNRLYPRVLKELNSVISSPLFLKINNWYNAKQKT